MKYMLALGLLAGALSACSPASEPAAKPQAVGGDRDAHGCTASAGYSWSVVRGQCLRIFEAGLRFEPDPAPTQGAVLAAYVVLAPAQGDAVTAAEVFLPGRNTPVALTVVHTPEGDIRPTLLLNRAERIEVYGYKDEHFLEVQGQRYRRTSPVDERLFRLR
jgi:hypothetical protein